jgi:hypothetical protein
VEGRDFSNRTRRARQGVVCEKPAEPKRDHFWDLADLKTAIVRPPEPTLACYRERVANE